MSNAVLSGRIFRKGREGEDQSDVLVEQQFAPGRESAKVLIVDDDQALGSRLARAFCERGYRCRFVESAEEAREFIDRETPTHLVVDLRLGANSGLGVVEYATKRASALSVGCRVIVLTGYGSVATALEAVRRGAANYLSKPAVFAEIEAALFGGDMGSPEVAGVSQSVPVPSLERVAWEHMQRVLNDCGGNVTRAAQTLGIHRQALQRRLRKAPPRQ